MTPIKSVALLVLLAACGRAVPPGEPSSHRVERAPRVEATPDTAVFVAKQAGEPLPAVSAVMQLRVTAHDAEVAVASEGGQQAMTGALGSEVREEIPGSRALSSASSADSAASGWRATVNVPVLTGERYLLELAPSTPRVDSAVVELTSDGVHLGSAQVMMDATDKVPSLFEVVVGQRSISVSPRIARVEIVPSCSTTHVVRSFGRADLFAQYEVTGTNETGDVRLPPRADDAQFKSVTFHTRTKGDVSISYLGRELASAARPEACPD